MATNDELACVYAALILHDDNVPITVEKMNTLFGAAGVTVEPYWPGLFVKMLESRNIDELLTAASTVGGAAPAAAAAESKEEAKEEEKEEEKEESAEESDEDMGFGLFD